MKNLFVRISVPAWMLVLVDFLMFIGYIFELHDHVSTIITAMNLLAMIVMGVALVLAPRVKEETHEERKTPV